MVEFGPVVIMASLDGMTNGNGTHHQGEREKTQKKIILNAFVEMCKYLSESLIRVLFLHVLEERKKPRKQKKHYL